MNTSAGLVCETALQIAKELGIPFVCVVARHLNGEGFIITAYRTNLIKIGETVWTA